MPDPAAWAIVEYLGPVVWLAAWGVLHARWRTREIAPRGVLALTLILVGIGLLGTFPPLWALVS